MKEQEQEKKKKKDIDTVCYKWTQRLKSIWDNGQSHDDIVIRVRASTKEARVEPLNAKASSIKPVGLKRLVTPLIA